VDTQLPRLPYMTRLDAFILTSTLLVFFSLIEVFNNDNSGDQSSDGPCKENRSLLRAIFPAMFLIAAIGHLRPIRAADPNEDSSFEALVTDHASSPTSLPLKDKRRKTQSF